MEITVECYAGTGYPERPRALVIEGKRQRVAEIEDRRRTPDHLHFRVQVSDGRRFLLAYHEGRDDWTVRSLLPR